MQIYLTIFVGRCVCAPERVKVSEEVVCVLGELEDRNVRSLIGFRDGCVITAKYLLSKRM